MSSLKLLTPVTVGTFKLKNRLALAPLTRGRADETTRAPSAEAAKYYAQRSTAGLVIAEATGVSPQGLGWYRAPGIYTAEHAAAWRPIVEAVRREGSTFVLQLWHMGRQAHSDVTGQPIVSASAIAVPGEVTALRGAKKPYETPEPLTPEGIQQAVADYKHAAANAKLAGFDMVEIHAANGYLIDQFLQSATNTRTDAYGGSVEKRLKFLQEVFAAVAEVYPPAQIGVRLSPNGAFGGMGSADNVEQFTAAINWLGDQKLAYVHLMDGLGFGYHEKCPVFTLRQARDLLEKTAGAGFTKLIGNVGYTRDTAEERIQADDADLIAFGRPYIANPDLPQRFAENAPLAEAEMKDWWTRDAETLAEGYTTWPTLAETKAN